jgi:hypothetical protein
MSYEPSKTSSTASSSIMFPVGTTRRRTNSPRSCRGESPSPRTSLRGTSRNRPSTSSQRPRAKGTLEGSLEPSRRRSYGRGPLERGVHALLTRGVRRGRGRAHGHGASPPRGGLARQVHRLDGSRGTSLRMIRGQTHRPDGQISHPRGRRVV